MSAEDQKDYNNRTQELLLLGEIRGLVLSLREGQEQTNRRIDGLEVRINERFDQQDTRLRAVEQKAAVAGAMSGGMVAVGTALVVEGIKQFLGGGGGMGP